MALSPEAAAREQSWKAVMERLRVLVRDDYDVLALLGYGGMAGVFLAQERRLKRRVALKVMSPELMLGHNMVERFHQEAVTQANLEHPNIAAVHAVREQGGLQFFAMQYVPGRTLQGALRKENSEGRTLGIGVVRTLLHQIGSALEYAHGEGVIHRDVKPGNVLLAADGRAVVTDFGIAKVTEGPALTMASVVQGTAAYMSPEQCYAAELSGASDQYSLGILAYELVTGRVPFTGDSFSVMQAHVGKEAPALNTVRADCPDELSSAVARMMAKHASDRFPTIGAALEAMHATGLSPRRDDPVRRELTRLADCDAVLQSLGDDVRRVMLTPRSSEQVPPLTSDRQLLADANTAPVSDPSSSPASSAPSGHAASQSSGSPSGSPSAHPSSHLPSSDGGRTPPSMTGGSGHQVQTIEIDALPPVLALGEQLQLKATTRDATGSVVGAPVRWTVEPPTVATVAPDGMLQAVQWGRAQLCATVGDGGAKREVAIIVGSVPLRRVEVTGMPSRVAAGSSSSFALRLVDMAGRTRALPIDVVSSDPNVLAVLSPTLLQARTPGRAEITVRCGTAEVRSSVVVTAAGGIA